MDFEKNNINMGAIKPKNKLPDLENALRNKPHLIPWTSKMVEDLIVGKVEDLEIRKIVITKLKKCPDGALQNFVKKIEQKIYEATLEISQKNAQNKPKKLTKTKTEYTVDDILKIRDQIFDSEEQEQEETHQEAQEEPVNEFPPSEDNL